MDDPKLRPAPSSSRRPSACRHAGSVSARKLILLALGLASLLSARDNWTELNVGPFFIDSLGKSVAARDALTQLEQMRWVLGGLLEEKDLRSTWPIRVMLTDDAGNSCSFAGSRTQAQADSELSLVPQHESVKTGPFPPPPVMHGQYLLVCRPGAQLPLGEIAGLLLDANTPRLPREVETGIRTLFDTLEAKGSRVTWGGTPPEADLAYARMQLFATKFEYSASFHIFVAALKSGSSLRAAEQNAFGQPTDALEKEAASRLAQAQWNAVAVSGRPLDPKRDFGEHSFDGTVAGIYLADAQLPAGARAAEQTYKEATHAEGPARPLGYEGLAQLAQLNNGNPNLALDDAIHAGSHSAAVYLASATDLPDEQAIGLLKKARLYNPFWAEPLVGQALLTEDPKAREELLKQATAMNRREPQFWIQLAKVQTEMGQASVAQGSWLRAMEAAPTPEMRQAIEKQKDDSEEHRLTAAAKAEEKDRNAGYYADQKAQKTHSDRVRDAERKANAALSAAAGGKAPAGTEAVPWSAVVPEKKVEGSITRVDCLGSDSRLIVRDRSGADMQLLLKNASDAKLACGEQKPARPASITYAADPDERFGTAGTVSTLNLWKTR